MTEENCDRCRLWKRLQPEAEGHAEDGGYAISDNGQGLCRRFPPVGRRPDVPLEVAVPLFGQDAADAAMAAFWPVTLDNDWCGEFVARLVVI